VRRVEWDVLAVAHRAALEWLESLPDRPVRPERNYAQMLEVFDRPVPTVGEAPEKVLTDLASSGTDGLMAMNHGRFFGWVIGGHQPVGLGADWLVAAWDQNTAMAESTPTVAAIEAVTARWVLEMLGLPAHASTAFVTGGQTANFVARSGVLERHGWNVEQEGLNGGPPVNVVVGRHRHHTIDKAVRILGLGDRRMIEVDTDGPIMRPSALAATLDRLSGPTIVCAQVGEVNTGAIDPISRIIDFAGERAWVHVDGAFGMWARLDDRVAELMDGLERADSWATDAHKWLNTPYDCGIAITAHPEAHRRAMTLRADYLPEDDYTQVRSPIDWNPEMSRRARAVPVYAMIRSLGRKGVAEMIRSCRDMAVEIARGVAAIEGGILLHPVVTNQVLIRFEGEPNHTVRVLERVQQEGVAYPTGTIWEGLPAIRISVSNWATDAEDAARTVEALARAHRAVD
jgi:glutamate/tyrosine decarboxylase-like PLP-dependent enzyme